MYLINHIPSILTTGFSLFTLYGFPPKYTSLHVFGCTCFVLLHTHECTKLSTESHMCVFLSYGIDKKKVYRCFDPTTNQLFVSHHVTFLEMIPFYLSSRLS